MPDIFSLSKGVNYKQEQQIKKELHTCIHSVSCPTNDMGSSCNQELYWQKHVAHVLLTQLLTPQQMSLGTHTCFACL